MIIFDDRYGVTDNKYLQNQEELRQRLLELWTCFRLDYVLCAFESLVLTEAQI